MSIGRVPGVTGIQPSIVDAKGDLIVATAADSVDRLAVGANNTVLTADSATATGLKWAAASSGKIKQVQFASLTTTATTTSTTFTDTGLSVSITPTSASNEILIYAMLPVAITGSGNGGLITLTDGSNNNLINASSPSNRTPAFIRLDPTANTMSYAMLANSLVFKHAPATTSAFTYKIRWRVTGAGVTALLNRIIDDTDNAAYSRGVATLAVMEYEV